MVSSNYFSLQIAIYLHSVPIQQQGNGINNRVFILTSAYIKPEYEYKDLIFVLFLRSLVLLPLPRHSSDDV